MSAYDALLGKAVQAIKHTFKKRNIGGLLSGRDGRLLGKSKQVDSVDDFELITWLVIKGELKGWSDNDPGNRDKTVRIKEDPLGMGC